MPGNSKAFGGVVEPISIFEPEDFDQILAEEEETSYLVADLITMVPLSRSLMHVGTAL